MALGGLTSLAGSSPTPANKCLSLQLAVSYRQSLLMFRMISGPRKELWQSNDFTNKVRLGMIAILPLNLSHIDRVRGTT